MILRWRLKMIMMIMIMMIMIMKKMTVMWWWRTPCWRVIHQPRLSKVVSPHTWSDVPLGQIGRITGNRVKPKSKGAVFLAWIRLCKYYLLDFIFLYHPSLNVFSDRNIQMDIYTEKSIEKNPVIFDQYDLQVVLIADLAWREGKYLWPKSWLSKPQAPDQIVDATINCYQPLPPPLISTFS